MRSLRELLDRFKRGPADVVGLDLAASGVKAVRMKASEKGVQVVAVDRLGRAAVDEAGEASVRPLRIPFKFAAKHASLAVSGRASVIKLLSLPGHLGERLEEQVVENIGLEDLSSHRIGYKVVSSRGGREVKVLAAALPAGAAAAACRLLPVSVPAPYSVEIAALASLTSFLGGPAERRPEEAAAVIDFGAQVSLFAFFRKRELVLVRKFDFGSEAIVDRVRATLGVDADTARGVVEEGSFDVSQAVGEVMRPFTKQFLISRDFVERRENCRISRLYATGGVAASRDWVALIESSVGIGVETWNPFEGLAVSAGALPEFVSGNEHLFCAAVGACLGTFEGE